MQAIEKFFNTEGPIKQDMHYCVDPLYRWDLGEVLTLIQQQKYFVLHAPRQTGKTSSLHALRDYLNEKGEYIAVHANIEPAQAAREDVAKGIKAVAGEIASTLHWDNNESLLYDNWARIFETFGPEKALNEILKFWAETSPHPIVLVLEGVDALVGDTLISLLRQIRAGYEKRPNGFPASIILCGIRDVRDYRIHSDREKAIITGGSAFNIKAESLRLGNFSSADIRLLYGKHTHATGQVFEEDIFDFVYENTGGQPWLVNALAQEACNKMKENRDRSRPISRSILEQAKENLILRRDTHLDQLTDKLQEERVKRVILPILSTEELTDKLRPDDTQYVADLGLIKIAPNGEISIANDIYKEIIPRQLSWDIQTGMSIQQAWYVLDNGQLDMDKLLTAFQQFFREHSESWIQRFQYHEAGPQLLLQAFLQRIVNGGGRIDREYGLGRGRTDLLLQWKHKDGVQREVIELKILRYSLEKTIETGLEQTARYMDKCGAPSGHLVIFDRRKERKWEEKIFHRSHTTEGKTIDIWGC